MKKNILTLLFAFTLIASASWELDFDDDYASASSVWTPLSLSPILWLKGNDSTADSSGRATYQTETDITYSTGINGKAFSLNGSSSKIDYAINPVSDNVSFCFWVKSNTDTVNRMLYIMNKGSLADFYGVYNDRNLVFQTTANTLTFSSFSVGQWYHVTAVKTSSLSTYYVNGQTNSQAVASYNSMTNALVGYINYAGTDYQFLNGLIDDVLVFDKALTSDEVAKIYAYRE